MENNKIDDIDKRISELKNKGEKFSSKVELSLVSIGTQICIELISGIIVGGGIGYILKEVFDFSEVFLICMIVLGGFAGFLNISRYLKGLEKGRNK